MNSEQRRCTGGCGKVALRTVATSNGCMNVHRSRSMKEGKLENDKMNRYRGGGMSKDSSRRGEHYIRYLHGGLQLGHAH